MLVPIKLTDGKEITSDTALSDTNFKSLKLKEANIEDFLRKNIKLIFDEDDDEDQSLIIVGQQVVDNLGRRSDLVALDNHGNLVLIEIKRDSEDMKYRPEPMELQAVCYAASLATIGNDEALVNKIFANYINKHKNEFELGERTPQEFARKKLKEFLEYNKAESPFNTKQRIILIASDFDPQTLSATAWMSKNGIDISCIRIKPKEHSITARYNTASSSEDITPSLFLEITRIIPPRNVEEFFVDFSDQGIGGNREVIMEGGVKKRILPKMAQLMEWGIIKTGDKLSLKNREGSEAEVVDADYVKFKGETLSYNDWGQKVTGWSKIGIYDWAVSLKDGKTLAKLREEALATQLDVNGSNA